jgi:7,8-dihydropterin-6-yl-methyl-4-(beta-D-ribofuranosyl)aminobenzene 5'-phosphate synthase
MPKLTCLVDNAVEPASSFWGEHGLAFLIESDGGRVLFDTGASAPVLLHNMQLVGVEPAALTALAISHAHYDHTGGLAALLARRPGLPLYANADLLRERFTRREGRVESRGMPLSAGELRQQTDLRLSAGPQQILPGLWTSGEISERPEPQGASPYHAVRQGAGWAPDPYQDDMALVLDLPSGLVLICGCCHAGLLNTLAHVRRTFGRDPVAVVGGAHLVSADAAHLRRLIEVLGRLGPPALYLNHCTGQSAYVTLAHAFGQRVAPCPAGTILPF